MQISLGHNFDNFAITQQVSYFDEKFFICIYALSYVYFMFLNVSYCVGLFC